MTLYERIQQDLAASMKAKDAAKTSVLRMAKAAIMNREIEKRSALEDGEVLSAIRSLVKQREDSVEQFRAAGRTELALKESAEIVVLRAYLPAEASDAEIDEAVTKALSETAAAGPKDMGRAMKAALALLAAAGKPADGKRVNEAVRRRLGA
jgi:uncharacterized protein